MIGWVILMSDYFHEKIGIQSPYNFQDKKRSVSLTTRYFLSRTAQIFSYTGLPESIQKRDMELLIQCNGFCGVTKVNDKLYAFYGGLGGEPNAYYMPTIFSVANPALNFTKNLVINEDCIIIPNDSLYVGLLPYINKVSTMLAETELSINIVSIMERLTALLTASTDREKVAVDKLISDVFEGKLSSVVTNKMVLEGISALPFSNTGSRNNITQLLELEQYWKSDLYNFIGVQSNYNMKRESLNSGETQMNEDILIPLIDDMLEQRQIAVEKINAMYGTEITVSLNSVWKEDRLTNVYNDERKNDDVISESK